MYNNLQDDHRIAIGCLLYAQYKGPIHGGMMVDVTAPLRRVLSWLYAGEAFPAEEYYTPRLQNASGVLRGRFTSPRSRRGLGVDIEMLPSDMGNLTAEVRLRIRVPDRSPHKEGRN